MSRYNILAICADDMHGNLPDGYMPYFEGEPFGNWIKFPNSMNVVPLCGPSRNTIWTGQYARRHGGTTNPIVTDSFEGGLDPYRLLAPALKKAGYWTAFVGKYNNGYPWYNGGSGPGTVQKYIPPGWDDFRAKRGNQYYDYVMMDNGTDTVHAYDTADYATDVETPLVEAAIDAAREPFFIQWSAPPPHNHVFQDEPGHSYEPGSFYTHPPAPRHESLYPGLADTLEASPPDNFNPASIADKPQWLKDKYPSQRSSSDVDDIMGAKADALRCLKSFDEGIEGIFTALNDRGLMDRTIIVFWADNANLFGEHRFYTKGVPYEEALRMHMRVRWPGVTAREDTSLVSSADLAATFADIAGATLPDSPDGMSFAPLVRNELGAWRDAIYFEAGSTGPPRQYGPGAFEGVRTASWKYVHHTEDDDYELYDLDSDPYEQTNLAGTGLAIQSTLAAKLEVLRPG